MEDINCNLCGEKQEKRIFCSEDKAWRSEGEFCLVECKTCGLVYVNPRPDETEINKYYSDRYYLRIGGGEFTQDYIKFMEKGFQARLSLIQRFKKRGRVLDIGCGDGHSLRYFKAKGYEAFGLDNSEFAVSLARKNIGESSVLKGTLLEANYPAEYFDVICLFEVLEHLHNPASILKEGRRILKKDGIIVITVPNFGSLERVILGDCWHGIDLPRHLYHFTKDTLRKIIEEGGFEVLFLRAINNHKINEVQAIFQYCEGLRVWLRGYGLYPERAIPEDINEIGPKESGNLLKKCLHIFEKIIFYPLVLIAEISQTGGALVAIAKK